MKKVHFHPEIIEPKKTIVCKSCSYRDILLMNPLNMREMFKCENCNIDICIFCILARSSKYYCYDCYYRDIIKN